MTAPKHTINVSSHAAQRVSLAQHHIESFPPDTELLLIAHSIESANDLHLRIVGARGAAFGVKRFSLNGLAARLAQESLVESETAPSTNLSFIAVVARAIHSLQSASKLAYFAPVATKPGFPIAVAKTIAELRMNEVPADAFSGVTRGGSDLEAIFSLVEEELIAANLSDRSNLFQLAAQSIQSAEIHPYSGLPLVLLDLSVNTLLEQKLIEALAARATSVFATAPWGDERTIQSLESALKVKRNNLASTSRSNRRTSLDLLKEHLFADSAPEPNKLDSTVKLSNWPGEPRECVEIVRSIQGEAARGVALDQIAVLLNSPGEYRSHLEEAFSRADIPAHFVQGITTPDPSGRAMLALLACAGEGLSAKRFAEYLSLGELPDLDATKEVDSQWVPPDDELAIAANDVEEQTPDTEVSAIPDPENAPIVDGALRTPARWERLIVESSVIGGKERWARRLNGLANELRVRLREVAAEEEALRDSIERQLVDLSSLQTYGLPLIERLSKLPTKASWGEWLAHLRELSVTALRDPSGVMATLADLEPMTMVGPVDLNEVQLVLESRLHDLRVKPRARHYGSVFVGPIEAARGLSFQVVFVPGLAERVFPRKIVEDSILPDLQRGEISDSLTTRRDQLDAQRVALRLAVGSARDRVYLSYPRIDVQQSRPRVPSFYALEALRAAEGQLPGFDEVAARAESATRARLGWPAPQTPDLAIDEAEYDLALLANLVESDKKEATGAAHYLLTANPHLARALRGRSRRWLRRWTPNDGLVEPDELAIASLANHLFSARSFSATALQLYSSCPYRFFLNTVMRLELRREPAAIEVIDPLTRGSLFHETQFEVLSRLKARGLLPLVSDATRSTADSKIVSIEEGRKERTAPTIQIAYQVVDEVLERLAAEYADRLAPAIPRVWEDGVNSLRMDLREWLRRMAEDNSSWVPDKFELSFGLSDRGPRVSDPASVDEPVQIVGDLKLRGSIDLVERKDNNLFRVTDHKTGKARAEKDTIVGGGKHLQPLLYALACQKLLNGKVESGRLYYCTADGGYEERVVSLTDDNINEVNSVLSTIRQGLIDGFLPAAPDEDACLWCDYLAVCGSFEEDRVKIKPKDRLIQLKALRNLP